MTRAWLADLAERIDDAGDYAAGELPASHLWMLRRAAGVVRDLAAREQRDEAVVAP